MTMAGTAVSCAALAGLTRASRCPGPARPRPCPVLRIRSGWWRRSLRRAGSPADGIWVRKRSSLRARLRTEAGTARRRFGGDMRRQGTGGPHDLGRRIHVCHRREPISGEPTSEHNPSCYIQAADLGRCWRSCEGGLSGISSVLAPQNELQGRHAENVPALGIRLTIRIQRFSKPSSSAVPFIRPTLPNGRVETLSRLLNETQS